MDSSTAVGMPPLFGSTNSVLAEEFQRCECEPVVVRPCLVKTTLFVEKDEFFELVSSHK